MFFDLALADLRRAAGLLAPVHEGLPAIEECIYAGVPVNVTLLFSAQLARTSRPAPWNPRSSPGPTRPALAEGLLERKRNTEA